jgi:hypothetical protein
MAHAPHVSAAASGSSTTWTRGAYAACLVLFPLLWGVFAGSDLHPDPSGPTEADQVQAVAESADAWRQVHVVLAAASLLGGGAVYGLYAVFARGRRLAGVASVFAVLGVAAAGVLAGLVLAEAVLVASLSESCAASAACVSSENRSFVTTFTDLSWNDVSHISFAAGTLIFSLMALAVLGAVARTIRVWEAALIVVGVVGIYATNTALHGDARYGLLLVFIASSSLAFRMLRGNVEPETGRHRAS